MSFLPREKYERALLNLKVGRNLISPQEAIPCMQKYLMKNSTTTTTVALMLLDMQCNETGKKKSGHCLDIGDSIESNWLRLKA